MIQSRFAAILPEGEKPFYFVYDADKTHVLLLDYGWDVAEFKDGKWEPIQEPKLLSSWEWKDITSEEFQKETGGKMPDVDPSQIEM